LEVFYISGNAGRLPDGVNAGQPTHGMNSHMMHVSHNDESEKVS